MDVENPNGTPSPIAGRRRRAEAERHRPGGACRSSGRGSTRRRTSVRHLVRRLRPLPGPDRRQDGTAEKVVTLPGYRPASRTSRGGAATARRRPEDRRLRRDRERRPRRHGGGAGRCCRCSSSSSTSGRATATSTPTDGAAILMLSTPDTARGAARRARGARPRRRRCARSTGCSLAGVAALVAFGLWAIAGITQPRRRRQPVVLPRPPDRCTLRWAWSRSSPRRSSTRHVPALRRAIFSARSG